MPKKLTKQQIVDQTPPELITEVFEHWRTVVKGGNKLCRLDLTRAYVIAKALDSYGLETTLAAITGCSRSGFHMGENRAKKPYNDLTLILRDADHIERFAQMGTELSAKEAFLAEG